MADRELKFNEQGLLPAVIQDWLDGTVLMLGYMNQEALARTLVDQVSALLEPIETETLGEGRNVGSQTPGQGPLHRL